MILRLVLILLPLLGFDKSEFYTVFARGDLGRINQELETIAPTTFPGKDAYVGALLMRRAQFRSFAGDKLNDFKAGARKLETTIQADSTNAEFRFLRLCIQEHAPRIVGYRSDLDRDNLYIHLHFKELDTVVQNAVVAYSQHSQVLKPQNF